MFDVVEQEIIWWLQCDLLGCLPLFLSLSEVIYPEIQGGFP